MKLGIRGKLFLVSLLLIADARIVGGVLGARNAGALHIWAKAHLGLAVLGVVATVFFVVDALGIRSNSKDEALGDFFGGTATSTITLLLAIGYCVVAGLAGGRVGRRADPTLATPKLGTDR